MKPWQLWGAVTLFLCISLYALAPILLPFVIAMVMAYLLDPAVDWFEERNIGRGLMSGLFVTVFIALIVGVFAILVPVLVDQATRFATAAPPYAEQTVRHSILPFLEEQLNLTIDRDMVISQLGAYGEKGLNIALQVLQQTALSTAAFVDILSLLLITPLVMFYLLRDWDRAKERVEKLLPRRNRDDIVKVMEKIDAALAAFMRGQLSVCLAQGLFYGIGLWLIGLQMGLLIGIMTGLLAFIPFLGMAVGLFTAFVVAVIQFQFESVTPYLLIAGVFSVGQMLEGFVLTPKLVGDKLGLHPAWVIFALLAGGQLGGLLGVLIALPMTAILSVLVAEGLHIWHNSDYYTHKPKATKASKKA